MFLLVAVTEIPKGTPARLRSSKAERIFLNVPIPLLWSVSFSKPSTEIAGVTFADFASL